MPRLRIGTLLAVLACPTGAALAQGVLVAPHAVVIDHRSRSGSISLYNPGDEPSEVTLSTFFGYPVTDSAGAFELKTVERPDATMPSAATWVEAFPKRMLLGPKERQTVRLLARPPARLADGEYWARLVVSAKGGTVPITGVDDSSGVTVGLNLEVRTILPLQYRKGAVATSVRLSRLAATIEGDSLAVRMRLERMGTAAFIGTVRGVLADSTGQTVATLSSPVAVYYDVEPRLAAALPGGRLAAGRYRLAVEVAAERED
ncbi:MAG: fimbrial biogenesis chaperone, partial [Gemmatimonadales bacterium]